MCIFDRFKGFMACLAKGLPILVTGASIATAVIPNPSPETASILHIVHQVLDVLALNISNNAQ